MSHLIVASLLAVGAICPHPFFPMKPGTSLMYRAGKGELSLSFSDARPAREGNAVKLTAKMGDKAGSVDATCGPQGVQTGAGGLEGLALLASGLEVEVLSSEGVLLPPMHKMREGSSWDSSLSIRLSPPKGKSAFQPVVTTTLAKQSIVIGEERVSVPAGTFRALKIKNRLSARSGTTTDADRTVESFAWLVKGIGIVKVATNDSVDLELLTLGHRPRAKGKR